MIQIYSPGHLGQAYQRAKRHNAFVCIICFLKKFCITFCYCNWIDQEDYCNVYCYTHTLKNYRSKANTNFDIKSDKTDLI